MSTPEPEHTAGSSEEVTVNRAVEEPVYVIQSEHERVTVQRNHAITRIANIIETIAMFESDVMLLKTRRDMLRECYKNFDQAQNLLEQWCADEAQNRDAVEIQYVSGLALFDKTIASKKMNAETRNSGDMVRLPAVDLPTFTGANENWLEWFDKFNALIHRRTTLEVIQKFEYLKLSLRGPALGLIDSLPTIEANYPVAYDLLVSRYNNPKLLVQKHTRELFELEPVHVESAQALRNLFDGARKNLRCLQILKQPVESWDAILVYQLANKLDPVTRREWESAASGSVTPTYIQLETFVLSRCQMLDAIPVKRKAP